jgi:hypothetical protein
MHFRISRIALEKLLLEDIRRIQLWNAVSDLGVEIEVLDSDLVGDLVLSILGYPEDNTVQHKADYENAGCYCRDHLNDKMYYSTKSTATDVKKLFDWLIKDLANLRKTRPHLFPAG